MEGAKLEFTQVKLGFGVLEKNFNKISADPANRYYAEMVGKFISESKEDIKELEVQEERIEKLFVSIAKVYSIDSKRESLTEVLTKINVLIDEFSQAKAEVEKEAKIAERKKKASAKMRPDSAEVLLMPGMASDPGENKEALMSDLMNALNAPRSRTPRKRAPRAT